MLNGFTKFESSFILEICEGDELCSIGDSIIKDLFDDDKTNDDLFDGEVYGVKLFFVLYNIGLGLIISLLITEGVELVDIINGE